MFNLDNYETVEDRLAKFWEKYPDGRIESNLIENGDTRFIVQSFIYRTEADTRYWTSGLAYEVISDRGVNSTSALENCETSAIGRALANAGFATKGKRASREEMSKVAASEKTVVRHQADIDNWEQILNSKPEGITTLAEGVELVTKDLGASAIPAECKHGKMLRKTGSNTKGSYAGWVCPHPIRQEQCKPIWAK